MNNLIRFDESAAASFIKEEELARMKDQVAFARDTLVQKSGAGNDFLGWLDLPVSYDKEEFVRIKDAAARISSDSEVFIVCGIGGSYLGARAAVEFTHHAFYNQLSPDVRKHPEIYFCGNSVSPDYLSGLLDLIGERDFSVNMISKSGTTTEPGIAFRILKEKLFSRYGKEGAAARIYATTDKAKGALKQEADEMHYQTFVVPDDVGGRFSVLTAVGLLPIAVAGVDCDALIAGALTMREHALTAPFADNGSLRYAAIRNLLYRRGYQTEIMVNYEPALHSLAEWWKQLFGESEGKDGKGIFPASVDFTTDLHSMGQYLQDGRRVLFETILRLAHNTRPLPVPEADSDADGLSYLAGRDLHEINDKAMQGTLKAHTEGGVPCLQLSLPAKDADTLGQLFYFFEFACGVSGYLLGVNPFDQPGVEFYKKNMFALLGKPGY